MKKQIENIFSKSKPEKQPTCPNPKIPIIIDTREKQSLIAANLINQKANIQFEHLDIADYIIGDTAIERKTFQDFIGSILNKRLIDQLHNLKKYNNHFLLLEGFYYNYQDFNIHENAIRGMLLSIANDFKIPIIYTENEKDTANFLILLAKKYEKPKTEFAIRQTKTLKSKEEQKQFILEGFPGIGPTTAKNLLEKFQTLEKVFQATEKELQNFLDKNKLQKFKELLD